MKIVVSVNSVIEVVDFDNALYGVPKWTFNLDLLQKRSA